MGFLKIFWKNNVQDVYLPKISISEQIVPEILAELGSDDLWWLHTNPSKFDLGLNV